MNVLDFTDAISRGRTRGTKAAQRVLEKWNRPKKETAIGQLFSGITADPELRALQNPADIQEMEARYGENQ